MAGINATAFLERLTAVAGDYNAAKVGTLGAMDKVFLDVKEAIAHQGQTIRIYFPDLGAFSDQGANDWNPDDLNPGFVDVPFGQRPGKAILVRDFEQFQTETDIINQYIDPLIKRALEYGNGMVMSQLVPGNFPTTPTIPGSGQYPGYPPIVASAGQVQIGDVRQAWNILVANKVPISGPENSALLYHPDIHANTLTDTNWYQESLVGSIIAASTRQQVAEPGASANVAFNFGRTFDQQAPTGQTAAQAGTVTTVNGSNAVVGVGTTFAAQAPAGSWITFGTDATPYYVKGSATDDNTHITLGQAYGGTGAAGVTYTRRTYTSIAMHKYCIALAVRPLDTPNNESVQTRMMTVRGLPMRMMLSYQHLKAAWLLTMDYGAVCKVIRPDFGILINS